MATATWNDTVIAKSTDTVVVKGNHYFRREAVTAELIDSNTHTGWRSGTASRSRTDLVTPQRRRIAG
jgi:uncharacterized protein (DUF427 family)